MAERANLGSPNEVKMQIFEHLHEVKQERRLAMKLHQECVGRKGWQFAYDDKCGSEYVHLPAYARESGALQGRYKYRFGLQGNLTPGVLLRFSWVPPCLKVGGNFGCTALLGYWLRLAELSTLGESFVRMTDSGPDNNTSTTHAFHWLAVHVGVLNRIEWIRLQPKHSHTFADRCNSMIKEVIQPKKGLEGGCAAPWDMEAVIKKAMGKQRGEVELAWQWQNLNWTQWFSDQELIHSDFADFAEFRHWIYEVIKEHLMDVHRQSLWATWYELVGCASGSSFCDLFCSIYCIRSLIPISKNMGMFG